MKFAEVDISNNWIPDILPLQHDIFFHQPPWCIGGLLENRQTWNPGMASGHGSHTHNLDCQKSEHDGENKKIKDILRWIEIENLHKYSYIVLLTTLNENTTIYVLKCTL